MIRGGLGIVEVVHEVVHLLAVLRSIYNADSSRDPGLLDRDRV